MEESRKALFFLLFLGVIDVIRYFAASRDVTNLIEYMHEEQAYKKLRQKILSHSRWQRVYKYKIG